MGALLSKVDAQGRLLAIKKALPLSAGLVTIGADGCSATVVDGKYKSASFILVEGAAATGPLYLVIFRHDDGDKPIDVDVTDMSDEALVELTKPSSSGGGGGSGISKLIRPIRFLREPDQDI
jgi:hypothetical protein